MEEKKNRVLEDMSELFEVDLDSLTDNYLFDSDLWDSLAVASTVASVHKHYRILIKGNELMTKTRLGQVFEIIDQTMAARS